MDLLVSLPTSLPLVVPSTTIRETRHRSLPLYNRLQQLIQDEARQVWVWWNEERRETATHQEEDEVTGIEGINDRNDRGKSAISILEHLLTAFSDQKDSSLLQRASSIIHL
jgi:exosome complex exonuclease DIS3/RRP44